MEDCARVAPADVITLAHEDGATVLLLQGGIDAGLRDAASRAMVLVLAGTGPVVVDASAVTFIDSSGLAFLLQVHRVAADAGRPVSLRDPSGVVLGLLVTAGLEDLFAAAGPPDG